MLILTSKSLDLCLKQHKSWQMEFLNIKNLYCKKSTWLHYENKDCVFSCLCQISCAYIITMVLTTRFLMVLLCLHINY